MNRDDIIRMARESGLLPCQGIHPGDLKRFFHMAYAAGAAAEREEIKQSIRHSLCVGEKTIQSRVYFGDKEVSMVKMPIEDVVAAAERNKLAQWMIKRSYATGHGDTVEDLLKELEWQIRESEREAFAQIAKDWDKDHPDTNYGVCIAEAIQARGRV